MTTTIETLMRMPHVRMAYRHSDGYCVTYQTGVVSPRTDCNLDHEETAREILRAAREAKPMTVIAEEN